MPTANSQQPTEYYDITLFVPCYNEEKNVVNTFATINKTFSNLKYKYEIIVVDDGSTDSTASTIKDYIKSHPEIKIQLIQNKRNMGLAYGFTEAAFLGSGKYFRQVNGDNDETVEMLTHIFSHMGQADIIIPYHQSSTARSISRRMLSNSYTTLINFLNGYSVKYYNGLAIYPRYQVMRWHSHSHGFGYQAELTTCLLNEGANYIEVPVIASTRVFGKSKAITITNILSIIHTFIKLTLRRASFKYHHRLGRGA